MIISPALGLTLLRREEPDKAGSRELPTPVLPVVTAEDRALCRIGVSATADETQPVSLPV